jgi:hypothetical protein
MNILEIAQAIGAVTALALITFGSFWLKKQLKGITNNKFYF